MTSVHECQGLIVLVWRLHQGYVYAVGGNDGIASLSSVERFDPHLNNGQMCERWASGAPETVSANSTDASTLLVTIRICSSS